MAGMPLMAEPMALVQVAKMERADGGREVMVVLLAVVVLVGGVVTDVGEETPVLATVLAARMAKERDGEKSILG
jgi:hypothetical protein